MDTHLNRNQRVAKNTLLLYIRMALILVVSLYTTRVILKVLGIEDYGVYTVVAGFVSMFSFLNSSLAGAIQRFYNFETSKHGELGTSSVYTLSLVIQLVLGLVVLILLETLGLWYVNNVMVIPSDRVVAANVLFQISSISLVLLVLGIPYSAAILSFEKMDYYAFVGIIDVVLKLAIVLALPFINADRLIVYSVFLLLISLANFLLYFIYSKVKFRSLVFNTKLLKKKELSNMLSFAGWNFFGTFSNIVYTQGTNILLNYFFGPVVNAARGIAGQVMSALQGFSTNVVTAFRPQMVNSYALAEYDRTRKLMFMESKVCYVLMAVFSTPIIIEIDYILHLWLGNNVPDFAGVFTCLVLVHATITSLNLPFSQVVHASGRMKKFQLVTGGITCMIIPIAYIALRLGASPVSVFEIGILMAVVSQVACVIIVDSFFPFDKRRYLIEVILKCILFTFLIPILPLVICSFCGPSLLRLFFNVIITFIVALPSMWFIVFNNEDRSSIKQILKRIRI